MGTTIQIGHSVRLRSDGQAYEILNIDMETKNITARRSRTKNQVTVPFVDIYQIIPKNCKRPEK